MTARDIAGRDVGRIRVASPDTDRRVAWVQRHVKRDLRPVECALVAIVCDAIGHGPYDIPGWQTRMKPFGEGVRFSLDQTLATFDFSQMTYLVFSAHDHCARVEIVGCPPGRRIELRVWLRQGRHGCHMFDRHPSLEHAVERWRNKNHWRNVPEYGAGRFAT